jgi:tripartite-type tricarboxylate transporter receptor subunit TctC
VHVLVPYGPGGVADLTMRLLGEKLGNSLKQQLVIGIARALAALLR